MFSLLEKIERRLVRKWEYERQKRALSPLYSPDPTDLDRTRHLTEAMNWLKRAQDAGSDRGVSYGSGFQL